MGASLSAGQTLRSWGQSNQGHRWLGLRRVLAQLLGQDAATYEPDGVSELLAAHEAATSNSHDFVGLSTMRSVQQLLSTERHETILARLRSRSSTRSQNLMLACSMPHASDWLLAPPVPGFGLGLQSDVFRTALQFRLGISLFGAPFPCPALSSGDGKACLEQMDVFGDHAP